MLLHVVHVRQNTEKMKDMRPSIDLDGAHVIAVTGTIDDCCFGRKLLRLIPVAARATAGLQS